MRLVRPEGLLFKDITETRHLSNHWTAGASLAWYPAFIAADLLARATGEPANGFSNPYITAAAFTSALCGLYVLLAAFALTRKYYGDRIALAATIAIWFGSPLAFYSTRHASMSHAISAAVCTGIVLLSLRLREEVTEVRVLAIGLAIGFACAVRPQNITVALIPLFIAPAVPILRRAHFLFAGALIAALPQLIVSQVLWGGPLVFVNIGGQAHSWQMFSRVRLVETLFSWYHGLVPWTPLLVLALAGLFFLAKRDKGLALAGTATFVSQWLLLGILERWFWGGASFGQRRFDACTLFFVLGLAALIDRLPRWLSTLAIAATTLWTMGLFIASTQLNLNRFQLPSELYEAFLRGLSDPIWRSFLGFTPPELHRGVLLTMLVITVVSAALIVLARRLGAWCVAVVSIYFLAMSGFYAWCGLNPKYDPFSTDLILRHERGELRSATARDLTGLLRDEAIYMDRVGRPEEASRALQEAAAVRP